MALLDIVSRVARVPFRVAGSAITTVVGLVPGRGSRETTPRPTDLAPVPAPVAEPAATVKPPVKGPVPPATTGATPDPAAPAAKATATKTAAKKAAATKAPAAKKTAAKKAAPKKAAATKVAAPPTPEPEPVTAIDADAADEQVDVTPADVADTMGSQLDDRPPSPS